MEIHCKSSTFYARKIPQTSPIYRVPHCNPLSIIYSRKRQKEFSYTLQMPTQIKSFQLNTTSCQFLRASLSTYKRLHKQKIPTCTSYINQIPIQTNAFPISYNIINCCKGTIYQSPSTRSGQRVLWDYVASIICAQRRREINATFAIMITQPESPARLTNDFAKKGIHENKF